jgi:hypothetical protein
MRSTEVKLFPDTIFKNLKASGLQVFLWGLDADLESRKFSFKVRGVVLGVDF